MLKPWIEIKKEIAKKSSLAQLKPLCNNPEFQNFVTREKEFEHGILEGVGSMVGVSHEIVRQALWLMENAPEEELEKLRSDEKIKIGASAPISVI